MFSIKNIFLGLSLLFIIGVSIWIQVAIPEMRGDFYNSLIEKSDSYSYYFAVFVGSLGFYYIMDSIRPLVVAILGLEIRKNVTEKLMSKPVCLEENADGRVSEDIRNFIEVSFSLFIDLFIAFFAILGLISQVPPDLMWPAVWYTVGVTVIAILFNKPLVSTQYIIQAAEQTFRMDIRKMLYGKSKQSLSDAYDPVYSSTVKASVVLTWFRSFASIKMLIGVVIPFALLIPIYMTGAIDFKILIQGVSTFDLLVSNTTILVNLYPFITKASASWKRMRELSK